MLAVTGSYPDVHVRFLFLAFGALGSKSLLRFFSLRVLRFWSNIFACWRLRFLNPLCTCRYYFSWLLVLWGASNCARKQASCMRPHWRRLRVWRFAAGRSPPQLFFRCVCCGFGLTYTHVGGCGFISRCARAIFFLGFWCFGASRNARKRASCMWLHWRLLRI